MVSDPFSGYALGWWRSTRVVHPMLKPPRPFCWPITYQLNTNTSAAWQMAGNLIVALSNGKLARVPSTDRRAASRVELDNLAAIKPHTIESVCLDTLFVCLSCLFVLFRLEIDYIEPASTVHRGCICARRRKNHLRSRILWLEPIADRPGANRLLAHT